MTNNLSAVAFYVRFEDVLICLNTNIMPICRTQDYKINLKHSLVLVLAKIGVPSTNFHAESRTKFVFRTCSLPRLRWSLV